MSNSKDKISESVQSVDALKLRQFISQIESLEGQKKEISEEITDIYNDIKNEGYDISVVKEIIRLRKKDEGERVRREAMIEHYKHILNME
jgi:uncharacterized protein (UPF0335 family)